MDSITICLMLSKILEITIAILLYAYMKHSPKERGRVEFSNPLLDKANLQKVNDILKKPNDSTLNLDQLALEVTKATMLLREKERAALREREFSNMIEFQRKTQEMEINNFIKALEKETRLRQYTQCQARQMQHKAAQLEQVNTTQQMEHANFKQMLQLELRKCILVPRDEAYHHFEKFVNLNRELIQKDNIICHQRKVGEKMKKENEELREELRTKNEVLLSHTLQSLSCYCQVHKRIEQPEEIVITPEVHATDTALPVSTNCEKEISEDDSLFALLLNDEIVDLDTKEKVVTQPLPQVEEASPTQNGATATHRRTTSWQKLWSSLTYRKKHKMIKNTSTKLDTVLLQSQNTESDEEDIVAILLNGESLYSRPVLEPDTKPQSDIVSHKKERSHRRANSWKRVWSYFDRKTRKNERATDNC